MNTAVQSDATIFCKRHKPDEVGYVQEILRDHKSDYFLIVNDKQERKNRSESIFKFCQLIS